MKDYQFLSMTVYDQGWPPNGIGIAYYQKGSEQYSLRAKWVYGKKEGEATLYDSHNLVCAQLTFWNDEVTGPCIIRDGNGIVRFRGEMVNGEKEGFCDEFNEAGVRIFSGYYKDQEKYSLFRPRDGMEGFWEEYSMDGALLTISEYDSHLTLKHGRCFFFENGEVVRYELMENGKTKYVCAKFQGDVMIKYNTQGKTIYEGSYNHDVNTLFCREGYGREFDDSGKLVYEGLFEEDKRLWYIREQANWKIVREVSTNMYVKVYQIDSHNIRMGRCNYFKNNELVKVTKWINGRELRTMVDINCDVMRVYGNDGELRYEGGFKRTGNTEMWSWINREGEGIEYLEDGVTIVYRGHFSGDKRSGKGIWYSHGILVYSGEWKEDAPNGYGTLMDDHGISIFDGTWEWGYLFTSNGWIDYESREFSIVPGKTELPKWGKRGGVTLDVERSLRHQAIRSGVWVHFLDSASSLLLVISLILCLLITVYLFIVFHSYGWFRWSSLVGFIGFIVFFFCNVKFWLSLNEIAEWMLPFFPFYGLYISIAVGSVQFLSLLKYTTFFYMFICLLVVSIVAVVFIYCYTELFYFPIVVESLHAATFVCLTHFLNNELNTTIGMSLSIIMFVYSIVSFFYYHTYIFHPFIDVILFFILFYKNSNVVFYGGIGLLMYVIVVVILITIANIDSIWRRSIDSFDEKRLQWLRALNTIDPSICFNGDKMVSRYNEDNLDKILRKHASCLSWRFLSNIPMKWYIIARFN